MNEIYNKSAEYYDFIYLNKEDLEYDKIVRDFLQLSKEILGRDLKTLLDLGCGTGTLAIKFTNNNVNVTGLDISKEQLKIAKQKIETKKMDISLHEGDMSEFFIDEKFDAAGAFFSGFCYLLTDEQVIRFLINMEKLINSRGILFFEFWNSHAIKPNLKSHLIREEGDLKLLRYNTIEFDVETGIATMPMHHLVTKNKEVIADFTEVHKLRTYTIPHLKALIKQTPWKIKEIYSGYYLDGKEKRKPKNSEFRFYALLTK
ncbi:MAG: class I SAM-dependent DNA methyltransferase [Candidatus Hodarchaeales archaeon]|jgi:SAM-dependent methyltransferase